MKTCPTALVYPTTKDEEERWGFDVYKPKGTPRAWVVDWDSASAGYGLSRERMDEVYQFRVSEDLSALTVDELFAACSIRMQYYWNNMAKIAADIYGVDKALELLRALGNSYGFTAWGFVQEKLGSPVPLHKIAWYQDVIHLQYGPANKAYTWFDEEKVVCTREWCTRRLPKGIGVSAKYCRPHDSSVLEGYMKREPALLCWRAPDLGEDGSGPRCIHVWTYNKGVVDGLPDKLKQQIPEIVQALLRTRGVQL